MTIRSFVVVACIVTFVSLPAGAEQPELRNGDSVGVRNVTLFRSPLATLTAPRELEFELCAGDPALLLPTGGLAVGAYPPGSPPVSCTPMATMADPRTPFGACLPYLCVYALPVLDPRAGPTSLDESSQLLETRITITPTLEDQTAVGQDEYNMILGLSKNARKQYLASRDADRSSTILRIIELLRNDDTTVPDPAPEIIFSDGFESGDVSVWTNASPAGGFATTP